MLEALSLFALMVLVMGVRFAIRWRGGYSAWDVLREQYKPRTVLIIFLVVAGLATAMMMFFEMR
jgi:hypothetical protein